MSFENIKAQIKTDEFRFTEHAMRVAYLIRKALEDKSMHKQDLAVLLNKSASEVTKWLSGSHNITIDTIAKIEAVLDIEIIPILEATDIDVPDRKNGKIVHFFPVYANRKSTFGTSEKDMILKEM